MNTHLYCCSNYGMILKTINTFMSSFVWVLSLQLQSLVRVPPVVAVASVTVESHFCQNMDYKSLTTCYWSRQLVCATCGGIRKRIWPLFTHFLFFILLSFFFFLQCFSPTTTGFQQSFLVHSHSPRRAGLKKTSQRQLHVIDFLCSSRLSKMMSVNISVL